jgi:uncharacterized protein YbjT (DUF2867 family)
MLCDHRIDPAVVVEIPNRGSHGTPSQAGVGARALIRNPHKTQTLSGITWVGGDLARPETLTTAFDGAKTLFLLTSYYEDSRSRAAF